MVYEVNIGFEVKYNILLVLMYLGHLACDFQNNAETGTDDVFTLDTHKYIINNGMINTIWLLVNDCQIPIKLLALCVLHTYIENYASLFPPAIEALLENYIRKSLANHKNPELQFIAHYMAKNTFGFPIHTNTKALGVESRKDDLKKGTGKVYIQPHDGILLDNDGLTVRNHTLKNQVAQVTSYISNTLVKGRWYWEIEVFSTRFVKLGYFTCNDEVHGFDLNITKPGEIIGVTVNLSDTDDRIMRVFYSSGNPQSVTVDPSVNQHIIPCIQIGPLQQVKFNFGEPLLKNNKHVLQLFKDKMACDLLSRMKPIIPPFKYTPPQTFRQIYTLPIKRGQNMPDFPKKKDKDTESKDPNVTVESSTSSTSAPWLPKEKTKIFKTEPPENDDQPPNEFCCPISKDIMEDPVLASDGYTYDRKWISKHLETKNVSPLTRMIMKDKELFPNSTIKQQIQEWKEKREKKEEKDQSDEDDEVNDGDEVILERSKKKKKKEPTKNENEIVDDQ